MGHKSEKMKTGKKIEKMISKQTRMQPFFMTPKELQRLVDKYGNIPMSKMVDMEFNKSNVN